MTPTDSPDASQRTQPSDEARPGADSPASHIMPETRTRPAGGGTDNPDAILDSLPTAQARPGADSLSDQYEHGAAAEAAPVRLVGEVQTPPATTVRPTPVHETSLADPFLDLAAAVVEDLEKVRMANANRLRILTTPADQEDEDGVRRGFGLDQTHADVARLAALVEALEQVEHQAVLNLKRIMRANPFAAWAKPRKGVGEKLLARLLAQIGDPYWNTLHDRPRTVSQLWAYSGLHVLPASHQSRETQTSPAGGAQTSDPGHPAPGSQNPSAGVAAKRRKGAKANWSTLAKTRAYLLAESVIKCGDPHYRAVYDQRRAHTAVTHPDWSKGHSHNDGLRIVSKAILRDLWIEARRLHGANDEQVAA